MRFTSKTPGVTGGSACIRNTRMSVWILVEARANGATDVSLLQDYPGLTQANLEAAWDYFTHNRAGIMDAILANRPA